MIFTVGNPFAVPKRKTFEAYYEIIRIIYELDTGYNQLCLLIYGKPEEEKSDEQFFIFLNKDMNIFVVVFAVLKFSYRNAKKGSLWTLSNICDAVVKFFLQKISTIEIWLFDRFLSNPLRCEIMCKVSRNLFVK